MAKPKNNFGFACHDLQASFVFDAVCKWQGLSNSYLFQNGASDTKYVGKLIGTIRIVAENRWAVWETWIRMQLRTFEFAPSNKWHDWHVDLWPIPKKVLLKCHLISMLSIRFHFTSLQANSPYNPLSIVFTQMANQKDKIYQPFHSFPSIKRCKFVIP